MKVKKTQESEGRHAENVDDVRLVYSEKKKTRRHCDSSPEDTKKNSMWFPRETVAGVS